ncbi:hypothetical protein CVT26_012595 [Gymnopilus dilepis]|uniref:Uncharacterized protein n=1 Tax=Gymnopilus dilepis TaxID=231916 RepID=A0A409WMP1_9AGAR|nr:hypothetical protein CVT26_012595 [Gymnopilus dilepis]
MSISCKGDGYEAVLGRDAELGENESETYVLGLHASDIRMVFWGWDVVERRKKDTKRGSTWLDVVVEDRGATTALK